MSLRMKLLALPAVIACAVVAVPQLAFEAKTGATEAHARNIPFTGTYRSATISTSPGYPAISSVELRAGIVTQRPGGRGAKREVGTVTGSPSPNSFTVSASIETFLAHGSWTGKFTATAVLLRDGSEKVTGKGRIRGGTERYQGARGRFSFNGKARSVTGTVNGTIKGTLVY